MKHSTRLLLHLYISKTICLLFLKKQKRLAIYDLTGEKVFESTSKQESYNVSNLSKGIYIVVAQIGGQNVKAKVYKKSGI